MESVLDALVELACMRAGGRHPQRAPVPSPGMAGAAPLHSVSIMDNFAKQRTGISLITVNTDHSAKSIALNKRIKGIISNSIIGYFTISSLCSFMMVGNNKYSIS